MFAIEKHYTNPQAYLAAFRQIARAFGTKAQLKDVAEACGENAVLHDCLYRR